MSNNKESVLIPSPLSIILKLYNTVLVGIPRIQVLGIKESAEIKGAVLSPQ
jgi:hypothetical protein